MWIGHGVRKSVLVMEITKLPCRGLGTRAEGFWTKKQLAALMPQVVSAWCRRQGHRVEYVPYYGVGDPLDLVPEDTQVAFIAAYTYTAPLAVAISRVLRARGVRTVIGGPHARSFPELCARDFDITVLDCDEALVGDVLRGEIPSGAILRGRPARDFPSIEERLPEIGRAAFVRDQPIPGSTVPVLASVGCPFTCGFCVDWNSTYQTLPTTRLEEDLRYAARALPNVTLLYQDPNFGIRFDEHVGLFERVANSLGEGQLNRYVIETSLGNLKEDRLRRLAQTGCSLIASGIESFSGFSAKAGMGNAVGRNKLSSVLEAYEQVRAHIPRLQANFVMGLDVDSGAEPFELAGEFQRNAPGVWAYWNPPQPYGGTPFYDESLAAGAVLPMPLNCYKNPYLTVRLPNYEPLEFVERIRGLHELMLSPGLLGARLRSATNQSQRLDHVLRTAAYAPHVRLLRRIESGLRTDPAFRAFHQGRPAPLPDLYRSTYLRAMGRFAEVVPVEDALAPTEATPPAG